MLFKIAWRNLIVHRKKNLAALLSIIVAFMALSLFEGYVHDVIRLYDITFSKKQMLGDILIERRDPLYPGKADLNEQSLSLKEQEWIDRTLTPSQVKARARFLIVKGTITGEKSRAIVVGLGYDVEEGRVLRAPDYEWNTFAGEPLEQSKADYPILFGRELGEVLNCEPASAEARPSIKCEPSYQLQVSTEKIQVNALDFVPVGLTTTGFTEIDKHLIMMPLPVAQKLLDTKLVSYVTLLLNDGIDQKKWIETFNQKAAAEKQDFKAQSWHDHSFGDLFRQSIDFLQVFRNLVISIILIVVSMATINIFVKIVNERIQEIGTMRSIGFQPRHILLLFCSEPAMLAVVGAVGGTVCSLVMAAIANHFQPMYNAGLLTEGVPFRLDMQAFDFVWITALITGLMMISTLLPVWKATKARVADLLADKG